MKNILIAIFVSILAAFATVKLAAPPAPSSAAVSQQTVFDRIMKTRVLRCGYVPYAPYLMKDPKTGEISGIFHDLTEKMAALLSLKVEWTTETSFVTFVEDIKSGRYDVYCGGLWPESAKAYGVQYSMPVNYVGLGIYVRKDDPRFDAGYSILNAPEYKFATLDGEMSQLIKAEDFPRAAESSHTQHSDIGQLLTDVLTKKADAVIVERSVIAEYEMTNPAAFKDVTQGHLIRLYPNTWAVKMGENNLIAMINTTLDEMLNSGFVEKTVKKYEKAPGSFYPVARPFREGK